MFGFRPSGDPALVAALNPTAIAIIGASDNPHKIGGRPLHYLSRFGYRGRVYPINPNRDEVQGFRSYPSLTSLAEAPDLAIVVASAPQVMAAIEECAAKGVRTAIIMTSGFGETSDPQSIDAERAIVARARAAGMRVVGPNSQGLANFGTGAVASFSTMFSEIEPADGPVAIVSQSGMMSAMPYGLLRGQGIGVRHVHATGNDADVTLPEVALAVLQDPEVRLLLLYIESIRDADVLAQAAALARERDVPIVALKTGRTARGQSAARSHTGALANEDRVVDAFFRQHGIWRVRDVEQLVGATELYLTGWRPLGRRLVVVSNSGAACVMAADAMRDVGLELTTLSDDTVRAISAELPTFATATNPIDITAALLTNSRLFGSILPAIAGDPGADLLYVALPVAGESYDVPAFARAAGGYAREGRPIAVATPQDNVAAHFRAAGVPTFASQTRALDSLGQLALHARLMRRKPAQASTVPSIALPIGESRFLSEAESLGLLAACGLPTVPHRVCRSEAEALEAYRALGSGRVVLKGCSAEVPHKSDHGLVVLAVNSEADVALSYRRIAGTCAALGVKSDGVIVARMVDGVRELALGARIDPIFGPAVMLGDGGRYVEILGDVALLLPPFTEDDVHDALATLRIAPVLRGVRGEPPADVAPFCAAAVRLGEIIMGGRAEIASIDLNPVIIGPLGAGVTIVDALIERAATERAASQEAT